MRLFLRAPYLPGMRLWHITKCQNSGCCLFCTDSRSAYTFLMACWLVFYERKAFAMFTKAGNMYFSDDGKTYTKSGNTVYGSDGSVHTICGNTMLGSDGKVYTKSGNTAFGSDGSVSTKSGNTIFHSDGSVSTKSGNTIFGKGRLTDLWD